MVSCERGVELLADTCKLGAHEWLPLHGLEHCKAQCSTSKTLISAGRLHCWWLVLLSW